MSSFLLPYSPALPYRKPFLSPRRPTCCANPTAHLHRALQRALSTHDFPEAARLSHQLSHAASDPPTAVRLANDAFYHAFRSASQLHMRPLWLQSDTVSCAHPMTPLAVGYDSVMDSWRSLFILGAPTAIDLNIITIEVRRNMAWIVCEQTITSVRGRLTIGGLRIATNVFQKRSGKWYVLHHHASPVLQSDSV